MNDDIVILLKKDPGIRDEIYSSDGFVFRVRFNDEIKKWELLYKGEIVDRTMTFGEMSNRHGFVDNL